MPSSCFHRIPSGTMSCQDLNGGTSESGHLSDLNAADGWSAVDPGHHVFVTVSNRTAQFQGANPSLSETFTANGCDGLVAKFSYFVFIQ